MQREHKSIEFQGKETQNINKYVSGMIAEFNKTQTSRDNPYILNDDRIDEDLAGKLAIYDKIRDGRG